MIAKLKMEVSLESISKLEHMFKDMRLSADLQAEFEEHIQGKEIDGVEFKVQILAMASWPAMEQSEIQIPKQIIGCQERFEVYYAAKNERRVLKWLYLTGQVEIGVLYTPKKYQLVVSVAQASILCLFNGVDQLSCKEI